MPVFPNPAGGMMTVNNEAEARAKGWTPSMGSFGVNSYPDSGGGGSPGGGSPAPTGGDQGFNPDAAKALNDADANAINKANNESQQAYLRSRLALDTETEARAKANDAWNQTFQREQEQNKVLLGLTGVGAQLRGPANYLQYLRTLNGTPQGLRDLVNAAAGRYQMSRFGAAPAGAAYAPATIDTLLRDVQSGGASGLAELGAAAGGPGTATAGALPSGSQWDARNYGIWSKSPTQSGLLQSTYDASGRSFDEELASFFRSLPAYGGAAGGRYAVPLAT
ncbi:MAG: hypothetical protein NUW22_13770 [Acidobacteria bacterium]|nr:hypothetical protein [Acidobacteriota bacterium]